MATERVLMSCIGTRTDWRKVVAVDRARQQRLHTDRSGRAVLESLMMRAATREGHALMVGALRLLAIRRQWSA